MLVSDLFTTNDDGTFTLSIHAQPGAGRSAVVGRHGDALKVRVAAPPERGRANDALAGLLAEEFGVKANDVELVSGATSRSKRFRVRGVEPEEVPRVLERLLEAGDGGGGPASRDRNRL
jgi:uncharacterized protein (TIGR00251 family)